MRLRSSGGQGSTDAAPAARGRAPVVVERSPRLRDGGYMLGFSDPGLDAAERMGVADALRAARHMPRRLAYVDGARRAAVQPDAGRHRAHEPGAQPPRGILGVMTVCRDAGKQPSRGAASLPLSAAAGSPTAAADAGRRPG